MQGKYVIAYDLGTGGLKASLHDASGTTLAFLVCEYPTLYYKEVFHEQRPEDWWQAICRSTRLLLDKVKEQNICKEQICALAISGHSLVGIPMDREGRPLVGQVPIWSDGRAKEQARRFFETHDYNAWYETTGNGDPPACYTLFKIMWMRENQPEIYEKTAYILGSKDYINFRLTGAAGTDYSYASGTGAFDLRRMCYVDAYIRDAGLRRELFLEPGQSHELLGRVTVQAAAEIGLCPGTLVARGGVDNACMALGSCGLGDDRVYMSLGSCAWISATTRQPVLDSALHPFVFAHVEKGWYCSAVSILSACTSLSWAKEMLCRDFSAQTDAYQRLDALAAEAPIGANGVLFNPSLAGGGTHRGSPELRGAFLGIRLGSRREDLLRAVLEGIALDLSEIWESFSSHIHMPDALLITGGGGKSALWREIFAGIFGIKIKKGSIGQNAASFGAAAIALRCARLWEDYTPINRQCSGGALTEPAAEHETAYRLLRQRYRAARRALESFTQENQNIPSM